MKRTKKLFALLMALALLLMTACGGGASSAAAPASSAAGASTASAESTGGEAAPAGEGEISLTWATFKGEWIPYLEELFAGYMEEHPEIKEINIYTSAGGDLFGDLKAMAASGTLPNIFNMRGDSFGREWKEYLQDLSGQPAIENVRDGFTDAFAWDGGIYGAYWNYEVQGISWNMQMLADAGFDSYPTTNTEFVAVCQALADMGIDPLVCCMGTTLHMSTVWGWISFNISDDQATAFNGVVTGDIDPSTSPEWAAYYDYLDQNLQYCQDNPLQMDNTMANMEFFAGNNAGYPTGGIQLAVLAKEYTDTFTDDVRIGPWCPDDENAFYTVNVQGYAVSNQSDEATNQAALDLYNWFYTETTAADMLTKEASILSTLANFTPAAGDLDPMTQAAYDDSAAIPMKPTRYFAEEALNNEWAAITQKYVGGEMNREEALAATGEAFRTYGTEYK